MRMAMHHELRESGISAIRRRGLTLVLTDKVIQSSRDFSQPRLSAIHMRRQVFDHAKLVSCFIAQEADTLCSLTSCPMSPACDARLLSVLDITPRVLSCCRMSICSGELPTRGCRPTCCSSRSHLSTSSF